MLLCLLTFFLLLLNKVASPASPLAVFNIFYFSMVALQYNIVEDPGFRQTVQGLSLGVRRLWLPLGVCVGGGGEMCVLA